MITVRKATLDDNEDFTKLMLLSAPYFLILFGDKIKLALQDLFRYQSNLFSFKHVYFIEVDGEKAGMILGYDWRNKKRENLRTVFYYLKRLALIFYANFYYL
jgi:hypothetical protein